MPSLPILAAIALTACAALAFAALRRRPRYPMPVGDPCFADDEYLEGLALAADVDRRDDLAEADDAWLAEMVRRAMRGPNDPPAGDLPWPIADEAGLGVFGAGRVQDQPRKPHDC